MGPLLMVQDGFFYGIKILFSENLQISKNAAIMFIFIFILKVRTGNLGQMSFAICLNDLQLSLENITEINQTFVEKYTMYF